MSEGLTNWGQIQLPHIMTIVCHEAVFLMLFSTVDYTHTVTKGQILKWKIQTPKQFFSSPKGIFCYDTVAAFGKPQCCCVWKWLADTVKLSRSEWLPLCRRLCGPGQDSGLQDYESYFTPHLRLCSFFLCVNVKHILRQFCCLKMHLWEPDLKTQLIACKFQSSGT